MEFLFDWGLFLLDAITVVVAILIVVAGISAIAAKNKGKHKGKLVIKKINDHFKETIDAVNHEILSKADLKKLKKAQKKTAKTSKKKANKEKHKLFIVTFNGDIKASAVDALRECVTAILLTAHKTDQVLVRLESPGGMVPGYGLAASQLQRLRDANIKLTAAVDKVAASGGYMMACVADKIISAPFAILGSIGVVYQIPNFNRFLKKKAIDFEQVTAGEYKRTLTMFGENNRQDRAKVQQEIDDMQDLFKHHVAEHRSQLDIDKVATGEHWYGKQAIGLKLVDELQTSDDFILTMKDKYDIFQIEYRIKQKFGKKVANGLSNFYTKLIQYNDHG
jgi:serine protease SohB